MKYGELLKHGEDYLKEAGIHDAPYDARIIFEAVTGMDRSSLLGGGDLREASETETDDFEGMLEKRASHIPVQYLTGEADFMGLRFYVNPDVLIPRFDTEFLVEEMMREIDDGCEVLDMCTGSGCILLSLMKYKNSITGTGADISGEALEVARRNEERIFGTGNAKPYEDGGGSEEPTGLHNAHEAVRWIRSDMFGDIDGRFDHIVCNPPYIRKDVIPTLDEEVKDHEPQLALLGDDDGLKFYRIIARDAAEHLKPYGRLYLEIGYDQGADVSVLLKEAGYRDIEVMKDYGGNDRVVKAQYIP